MKLITGSRIKIKHTLAKVTFVRDGAMYGQYMLHVHVSLKKASVHYLYSIQANKKFLELKEEIL